jgi:16S rRNA (guanine527-N7)-methyltransferase
MTRGQAAKLAVKIRGPEDFAAAFDVSRETLERLEIYEKLLRQWQKAVNLVAPSTLDAIWHRHFADSAQLLAVAGPQPSPWLDLGSGAGFPGLVVAILLSEKLVPSPIAPAFSARGQVVLIESNARKGAFLREVVRQTGILPGVAVDILSIRIETAATQANLPRPAVVSARALAPLERLLALAAPLVGPSTTGLFLKGRGVEAEIAEAKKAWNFSFELVPSLTEPDGRVAVVRHLEPKLKG